MKSIPNRQTVSKLLLKIKTNDHKHNTPSNARKIKKIETRKVHPEYLIPEKTKYQREEIFKRDFVFRNENKGIFKEDYMSTMFEMLYYNKKHYYINRNQLSIQCNHPVYLSSEYPNLNAINPQVSQTMQNINNKKKAINHKHYIKSKSRNTTNGNNGNNGNSNLLRTYTKTRENNIDSNGRDEDMEEEYSFSFTNSVKEKYDSEHKEKRQIELYKDLSKKYDFYNRKHQKYNSIGNAFNHIPIISQSKRSGYLNTHTPHKRIMSKAIYSKVNQFQLGDETEVTLPISITTQTPLKSKILLTPKQVLSSNLFLNKGKKITFNIQKRK